MTRPVLPNFPYLVFAVLLSTPAWGAEIVVEFFRSNFLPQSVTVQVGDVVTWSRILGEHTVTSGSGPDDPEAGKIFDSVLNEGSARFSFPIEELRDEGITFFCRNHPTRTGFVEITSGEISVRVGVVDNVFIPEESYIFEGDSIKWEHEPMEMLHTMTSGLSSLPEHNPGRLFDAESSDAKPIFVYRFAESAIYPYFCRPHEILKMRGTIFVQSLFVRGDSTGNGVVDISDAVATLNHLFVGGPKPPCDDALDSNDDGQVDITDPVFALTFLFLGGSELPAPFPAPGADRTEDELYCWPKELEIRS